MLKIHQPYSTTLKIESKFPSLASRLCRIWPHPFLSPTSYYSLPCSDPPSPASSLAGLTGAFLPSVNLLLPLSENLIIQAKQKLPRENTMATPNLLLCVFPS